MELVAGVEDAICESEFVDTRDSEELGLHEKLETCFLKRDPWGEGGPGARARIDPINLPMLAATKQALHDRVIKFL